MVGDVYKSDGEEFEVIWDGGEGLVAPRESRPSSLWAAPLARLYNRKSAYWDLPKKGHYCRTCKKLYCICPTNVVSTPAPLDKLDEAGLSSGIGAEPVPPVAVHAEITPTFEESDNVE